MDAADELWEIREGFKTLLVDFDDLADEKTKKKRDELIAAVGKVNIQY